MGRFDYLKYDGQYDKIPAMDTQQIAAVLSDKINSTSDELRRLERAHAHLVGKPNGRPRGRPRKNAPKATTRKRTRTTKRGQTSRKRSSQKRGKKTEKTAA